MAFSNLKTGEQQQHSVSEKITGRALVWGLVLSLAGILWIHQASLVQAPGQLYAPVYLLSVPPVPAIIFLFVLAAGGAALAHKIRWRAFSSRELMIIYMMLVVAIPPTTFGIIEMLLPWITSPSYFGTPQDGLDEIADRYFPSWMYPHDKEAIRMMFEGSDTGAIPWRVWLAPLSGWLAFVLLVFFTMTCLLSLFHRQWSEKERLRYPVLLLPLSVADPIRGYAEIRGLFRNPLTWLAIAVVFVHHALNVAHSYNPAVMALMDRYYLGRIFTERPWTAFRGLTFFHRPELIGFSYFVSVDVLLSGWFFYVIQMFIQMMAEVLGYQASASFPYAFQQGCGAYIVLFITLLWVARHHLRELWRAAFGFLIHWEETAASALETSHEAPRARASFPRFSGEPLSPTVAIWGTILGFGLILLWCVGMKMALWLAAAYFGLLISWAVVYARVRAEAGVASMWAFPFDQHPQLITALVGQKGLLRGTDATQLVLLSVFSWMTRGYFPSMAGYVLENEKLAQETGVPLRAVPWLTIGALVVGMIGGYVVTLKSFYDVGANVLHGGTSSGGYNVRAAMSVWNGVAAALKAPSGPNTAQVSGAVAGALVTILLVLARRAFLRFPFHPLGYAIALNYGYCLWGPFFVAWLMKLLIDRLGGAEWYRKLMPFFLGLAVGDLVAGGLLWIIMAILGPDITNGYMIQFG